MTFKSVPRGRTESAVDRPMQAVNFRMQVAGDHAQVSCEQCSTNWDMGDWQVADIMPVLVEHAHRCVRGIPLSAVPG